MQWVLHKVPLFIEAQAIGNPCAMSVFGVVALQAKGLQVIP